MGLSLSEPMVSLDTLIRQYARSHKLTVADVKAASYALAGVANDLILGRTGMVAVVESLDIAGDYCDDVKDDPKHVPYELTAADCAEHFGEMVSDDHRAGL